MGKVRVLVSKELFCEALGLNTSEIGKVKITEFDYQDEYSLGLILESPNFPDGKPDEDVPHALPIFQATFTKSGKYKSRKIVEWGIEAGLEQKKENIIRDGSEVTL